jgi:hypothetical protein
MIEMLTGFALVSVYVSSFVDWRREPTQTATSDPAARATEPPAAE